MIKSRKEEEDFNYSRHEQWSLAGGLFSSLLAGELCILHYEHCTRECDNGFLLRNISAKFMYIYSQSTDSYRSPLRRSSSLMEHRTPCLPVDGVGFH